ncbi:Dot/Icm T4SS effector [Legionella wadsworthii]|uniref:Dot/Icm T4SS effector n=1 Tax=Legionella wadsworthii TaxID=28088 RepID=A0A378LRA0_9GAMM|nr:hypothetical protein [Legionella wadsworthii]STY28900.1 Dot/Icm T4SS effector [Legionella wadsworthii]
MGFQYVEYDTLAKYIRESIATEVRRHGIDDRNLTKALRILYISHPERATQCKYLLAVLNCLDKSSLANKECVLNAAAFYIRDQISVSYKEALTSRFLAPENSTLFNTLTTSLNLTLDNFPDSKNLLDMYDALNQFMHAHVYQDGDPRKGYLDLSKQPFANNKIKKFKVEKVLQDLVTKVAGLRLKLIDKAKEEQSKESSKKPTRLGLFSENLPLTTLPDNPSIQDNEKIVKTGY